MSSIAPASPKGSRQQGGRRQGRGSPHSRYWAGRGGRGGRGRGRGGRGRSAGRGRGESSTAHRPEEDIGIAYENKPQDQSEAVYSKSMTAMLKKQLGLDNGDPRVSTNFDAAAAGSSKKQYPKQRCDDKRQRSQARPKPKKKNHPKNSNQQGKKNENSHQDHSPQEDHHRTGDEPSTESTAFLLPDSRVDAAATRSKQNGKKHRNRPTKKFNKRGKKNENSHQDHSPQEDHHCTRDEPSTESTTFPSLDHRVDVAATRSKKNGKQHRNSPTRPVRPKPSQKKYSKKSKISTQQGKENVCNHDSNKLSPESSTPPAPSKHADMDTVARPKSTQEKLAMNSINQQAKESQKKNQPNRSQLDSSNTKSTDTATADVDTINASGQLESEKERTNRLLHEAREKSAAAKEKKKSKKSKKHDKWLNEQGVEKSMRAKSWHEKITKENESVELISDLIASEFLRQNKGKTLAFAKEQLSQDSHLSQAIVNESQNANNALYGGLNCRVKVAALDRQDINGRQGTLRHWDAEREKLCVGLDTKKSADSDVHYLMPENLEATSAPRYNKAERKLMQGYTVEIKNLFSQGGDGIGCRFTLEKSAMDALRSAESIDAGLRAFCLERDEGDHRLRLELEEERRQEKECRNQEELDRKRRVARRAKERVEMERGKEQWCREREEATRAAFERRTHMKMEQQKHMKMEQQKGFRKLRLKLMLYHAMKEGVSPEDLLGFFEVEGFGSDDFDSDDEDLFRKYSEFYEKTEGNYEKELRGEEEEKSKEMAEILGVEPDTDERTLKVTYRKLALKFHPDKWRSDSDHGMAREESLDHFKTIQNAYDFLMSRFDDDEGDDQ